MKRVELYVGRWECRAEETDTMTVGELIEILEQFDESLPIVATRTAGCYSPDTYGRISKNNIEEIWDEEDEEEEK